MKGKCPFCEIDSMKSRVVASGKSVYAMLSNPRLVPGHLLVIPKRHVEKFAQLTQEERNELFAMVVKFQEKIVRQIALGCDIRSHYRPFLAEGDVKVNHLHMHLHPRFLSDPLFEKSQIFERELFQKLPEVEKEKFSKIYEGA